MTSHYLPEPAGAQQEDIIEGPAPAKQSRHWAVLIGVDVYPQEEPQSWLRGAAADAQRMKDYISNASHPVGITLLTSTRSDDPTSSIPRESPPQRPTRDNVVSSLKRVLDEAKTGDLVLLYFAGQALKTKEGVAIGLLDADGRTSYFHSQTLTQFLQKTQHMGLLATVVLDCSYSGALFWHLQRIISAPGLTILTASGPHGCSTEIVKENGEYRGFFSYLLLTVLEDLRKRHIQTTQGILYEFLFVKTQLTQKGPGAAQGTPMCFGNKELSFFGKLRAPKSARSIPLFRKDAGLYLSAGEAHGVCKGDTYRAHHWGPSNHAPVTVRVKAVHAFISELAGAEPASSTDLIRSGWKAKPQASLTNRKIHIRITKPAYDHISKGHNISQLRFVRLSIDEETEETCAFNLGLNEAQEYYIYNAENEPIKGLPSIPVDSPGSTERVIKLLQHVASFRYFEGINRPDEHLRGEWDSSFTLITSVEGEVLLGNERQFHVKHGDVWSITIRNHSDRPLYLSLFHFTSCWTIHNLGAESGRNFFEEIPPNKDENQHLIRLMMEVPEGLNECEDVIKVFLTSEPTLFPAMDLGIELETCLRSDLRTASGAISFLDGIPEGPGLSISPVGQSSAANWSSWNYNIHTIAVDSRGIDHTAEVESPQSTALDHRDSKLLNQTGADSGASPPWIAPAGDEQGGTVTPAIIGPVVEADKPDDSGYASASRMAPSASLPEHGDVGLPHIPELSESEPHEPEPHESEPHEPEPRDHDEAQSILSDDSDIRSQASSIASQTKLSGRTLLRVFLSKEPRFAVLARKTLVSLGRQRFVENMRRLLKRFYRSLSEEAGTPAERTLARLLRSREGRRQIGVQLADYFEPDELDDLGLGDTNELVLQEHQRRVEEWAKRSAIGPQIQPALEDEAIGPQVWPVLDDEITLASGYHFEDEESGLSSEFESEDDEPDLPGSEADEPEFSVQSQLESFLERSASLQSIWEQFMTMFLPWSVAQVLISIPAKHIWLSDDQDLSLSNRVKTWVEETTKVPWNWWPLEPRKRLLRSGESRLFWQCTCGIVQWEEITTTQKQLVQDIMDCPDFEPRLPYWCQGKKERTHFTRWIMKWIQYVHPSTTDPGPSTALANLQASNTNPNSSVTQRSSVPKGQAYNSGPNQGAQLSTSGQTYAAIRMPDSGPAYWILLGIRGASIVLKPCQVLVNSDSTDYKVFQEMKDHYRVQRGRLRLWLSIWHQQNYQVVRFSRVPPNGMVRDFKDLPEGEEYRYKPRAGEKYARNPPISPHLFQTLSNPCQSPCRWFLSHPCVYASGTSSFRDCIPKREKSFQGDDTIEIWGLEAKFEVSNLRVVAYHVVILLGPFVFWWCWLAFYPDDVQSASVPLQVGIAGVALFFSSFWILTSSKDKEE